MYIGIFSNFFYQIYFDNIFIKFKTRHTALHGMILQNTKTNIIPTGIGKSVIKNRINKY